MSGIVDLKLIIPPNKWDYCINCGNKGYKEIIDYDT